jgi:hypothetical protein
VVTATRYPEASRITSIELAASSSPSRSGSLGDGEGVGVGLGDGGVVGVGVGVGVTVGEGVTVGVGEGVGVTVGEGEGVAEELGVGLGLGVSDLKVAGTETADKPPAGKVPVGVTVRTPVPEAWDDRVTSAKPSESDCRGSPDPEIETGATWPMVVVTATPSTAAGCVRLPAASSKAMDAVTVPPTSAESGDGVTWSVTGAPVVVKLKLADSIRVAPE